MFGDMQLFTVNHSFDQVPEVAFLVKVDGFVIYQSGDHASTTEVPNPTFTGNIDYLAGRATDSITRTSEFGEFHR
jgi:hypothetical protein